MDDPVDRDDKILALELVADWQLEQILSAPLHPTLSRAFQDPTPSSYDPYASPTVPHLPSAPSSPPVVDDFNSEPESSFGLWGVPELGEEMVRRILSWNRMGDPAFTMDFVVTPSLPHGGYLRQMRTMIAYNWKSDNPTMKDRYIPPVIAWYTDEYGGEAVYLDLHPVPSDFPHKSRTITPSRHSLEGQKVVQQILKDLGSLRWDVPVDYLVIYSRNLIDDPRPAIESKYPRSRKMWMEAVTREVKYTPPFLLEVAGNVGRMLKEGWERLKDGSAARLGRGRRSG